ncbi:MAG TPA: Flp family type IVb pilin [Clostridia bacterium]|nr:Flp family type IVb pilin [Clostridia bacterium]
MMMRLYNFWYEIKQNLTNKKGQGMVEYALIIGLIAVVLIVVLGDMGTAIQLKFQEIVNNL